MGIERRITRAATIAAMALAIGATAAGCGDDGETADGANGDAKPAKRLEAGISDSISIHYGKPASREPTPRIPSGPPPKELKLEDFREGSGPEVEVGDAAIVNYVGYHYGNKRQYDTSYGDNPVPYRVVPGDDHFIDGFEEGIVGMKEGGLRQITMPPDKAYGDRGYSGQVKPGETVVFVVLLEDLVKQ